MKKEALLSSDRPQTSNLEPQAIGGGRGKKKVEGGRGKA